jgi:hypothetical protein
MARHGEEWVAGKTASDAGVAGHGKDGSGGDWNGRQGNAGRGLDWRDRLRVAGEAWRDVEYRGSAGMAPQALAG